MILIGQWVALTTGGLAIFLVVFQSFTALLRAFSNRGKRGLSQVEPDVEIGSDGFKKKFANNSTSSSVVEKPPKKDCVSDQPPLPKLTASQGGKLDSRPARERSPEPPERSPAPEPVEPPLPKPRLSKGGGLDSSPARERSPEPPERSPEPLLERSELSAPPPKVDTQPELEALPSKLDNLSAQIEKADPRSAPESSAGNTVSCSQEAVESLTTKTPPVEKETLLPVGKEAVSAVPAPQVLPKPQTLEPLEVSKPQSLASPAVKPLPALPARKVETHTKPFAVDTKPFLGGMTFNATFTMDDQALGFELRFVGGCPVVTKVVDRSPACVKGVSVQSRALAVNGVPLRGPWPLRKMSKQQWLASVFSSRPLTITFEQTAGKVAGLPDLPQGTMSPRTVMSPVRQLVQSSLPDEVC